MYKSVLGFLNRKCDENHAVVRALSCCPESNRELPIRSFVEEFGPDGSFPRTQPFDWTQPLMLCLDEFERQFFREHGMAASEDKQARAITDLRAVGGGVRELGGVAQMQGNRIEHRAVRYAPYCTTVIFPEKSFFTPNLLSPEVPVSFPMLVFGKNSDVHQKLLEYFEFQWWISASHD